MTYHVVKAASFAINAGVFGVKGNEKQEEIVTGEWHWKVTLVICMFFLICRVHHVKCHVKSRLLGEITTSDMQMTPP